MEVRSDRVYRFDMSPEDLWQRLDDVGSYRSWWPWLRRFDAAALEPGAEWDCAVQPPLPYVLRFTIVLGDVVEARRVDATVDGDISGTARIDLVPAGDGTELRLRSSLAPANRYLRTVARFARPVVRFGHDWVLDTGARQFRRQAL